MVEFMRGSTFIGTLPTSLNLTRQTAHPNVRPMFDCYHFWAGLSKFEDLDLIRHERNSPRAFSGCARHPARELPDNGTREIPGDGVSPLVGNSSGAGGRRKPTPAALGRALLSAFAKSRSRLKLHRRIRRKSEPILRQAGVPVSSNGAIRYSARTKLTKIYRSGDSDLVVFADMNFDVAAR